MKRSSRVVLVVTALLLVGVLFKWFPRSRNPSERDLERILARGTTEKAVIEHLGKPYMMDESRAGAKTALYHWPRPQKGGTNQMTALQIHYSSNRVMYWLPVYSDFR